MKIVHAIAAWILAAAALVLCACLSSDRPRIGFLVKMPEQGWFINEQKTAAEVGRQMGFDVVGIGVQDGEKVLSAMDNLAAQGAQGMLVYAHKNTILFACASSGVSP